jgi:hypothetical protein
MRYDLRDNSRGIEGRALSLSESIGGFMEMGSLDVLDLEESELVSDGVRSACGCMARKGRSIGHK